MVVPVCSGHYALILVVPVFLVVPVILVVPFILVITRSFWLSDHSGHYAVVPVNLVITRSFPVHS